MFSLYWLAANRILARFENFGKINFYRPSGKKIDRWYLEWILLFGTFFKNLNFEKN